MLLWFEFSTMAGNLFKKWGVPLSAQSHSGFHLGRMQLRLWGRGEYHNGVGITQAREQGHHADVSACCCTSRETTVPLLGGASSLGNQSAQGSTGKLSQKLSWVYVNHEHLWLVGFFFIFYRNFLVYTNCMNSACLGQISQQCSHKHPYSSSYKVLNSHL